MDQPLGDPPQTRPTPPPPLPSDVGHVTRSTQVSVHIKALNGGWGGGMKTKAGADGGRRGLLCWVGGGGAGLICDPCPLAGSNEPFH